MNTIHKKNEKTEYERFLAKKSHDSAGGSFFAYYLNGTLQGVEWARNEKDIIEFLTQTQQRNEKTILQGKKLLPVWGNKFFSSIKKLV